MKGNKGERMRRLKRRKRSKEKDKRKRIEGRNRRMLRNADGGRKKPEVGDIEILRLYGCIALTIRVWNLPFVR